MDRTDQIVKSYQEEILELKQQVYRLEKENTVLKQNISKSTLKRLEIVNYGDNDGFDIEGLDINT